MANIRFDLRSRYSLLHAFDEVGRAQFPKDWHGDEAWAKPAPICLEEIQQQRMAAETELERVLKSIIQTKTEFDNHQTAIERDILSSHLSKLYADQSKLRETINSFPDPTQGDIQDARKYARRAEVEQRLSAAFQSDDLTVIFGRNSILPWVACCCEEGFSINYPLSQVTLPAGRAPDGAHPAFIDRQELDDWIKRMFEPQDDGTTKPSPDEMVRQWLEAQVKILAPREKTKSEIKQEALKKFTYLKTRRFENIWAHTVPDSWKKPGAPSK